MDERAHKVMTPEEYAAVSIKGWHRVCRDVDGAGNVGVQYEPPELLAEIMRLKQDLRSAHAALQPKLGW